MHVTGTNKCRIEENLFISILIPLKNPGRPLEMNDIGKVRLKLAKPLFFAFTRKTVHRQFYSG